MLKQRKCFFYGLLKRTEIDQQCWSISLNFFKHMLHVFRPKRATVAAMWRPHCGVLMSPQIEAEKNGYFLPDLCDVLLLYFVWSRSCFPVSNQASEDDLPLQVRWVRCPRGPIHRAFWRGRQRAERHHRSWHKQPQDPGPLADIIFPFFKLNKIEGTKCSDTWRCPCFSVVPEPRVTAKKGPKTNCCLK